MSTSASWRSPMNDVAPSGIPSTTSCTTGGTTAGGGAAPFFREANFFPGLGHAPFFAATFFGFRARGGAATGGAVGEATAEGGATAGAMRCYPARLRLAPTWVAATTAATDAALGREAGGAAGAEEEAGAAEEEEAGAGRAGAGAAEGEAVAAGLEEAEEARCAPNASNHWLYLIELVMGSSYPEGNFGAKRKYCQTTIW